MTGALADVAALIRDESGIDLRPSQRPALNAALARMDLGPEELLLAAADPRRRRAVVERLLDEVSVQETYFYRAVDELRALDWRALHARAAADGRGHVRVWNPGCSTGAEAFTVLMLAAEAFGLATPPVRVLATDIAAGALATVASGRFGPRALRRVPPPARTRWFVPSDGAVEVVPDLRAAVEPRRHNLVREPAPEDHAFDVVLCRNVLIYFQPAQVRRALGTMRRALAPDGVLVLGAADKLVEAAARPPARPRRALRRPPRAPAPVRAPDVVPDPLDPDALYAEGVAHLAGGDVDAAVRLLRRAVYAAPDFAPAAFQLARAHERAGAEQAAARAYAQAERATADPDLAAACRARLAALREVA